MEAAERNLNVRPMTAGDADAVIKIQVGRPEIAQWTAHDYASLSTTGRWMAWVAEVDGILAGCSWRRDENCKRT